LQQPVLSEMIFRNDGTRIAGIKFNEEDIQILQADWKSYVQKIPKFPKKRYSGRGIVYTAGGIGYITCAWVSINLLRQHGCLLPIELWYLGNEVSDEVIQYFKFLNVDFRNFQDIGKIEMGGYSLKPLAILHSRFKEVLFLDADNNCVKDPTDLFEFEKYKEIGTVFWPDYWRTSKSNPIWKIIGTTAYHIPEQESGQLLVNKEKCWKELNLCLYFNKLGKYYYRILLGDKDTFKFSWHALKTEFYMIKHFPGTCGKLSNGLFYGNTMVQFGPNADIYFLHRNLLKWDITHSQEFIWEKIKFFAPTASKKMVVHSVTDDLQYRIDFEGNVEEKYFKDVFNDLEHKCHLFLDAWRYSSVYQNFLEYAHFAKNRYRSNRRFDSKIHK
jgi:alpha 1,2-mannosyltransferase